MRRLYLFCLLVFIGAKSFSQTATCAQTLRLARATYEQGRLHEIESQLGGCLQNGFTKEEKQLKVEGYKLLCLSYIYLEEPVKADEAMLNLKRTDPYFVPNPQVDPAEFVSLYKTFRERPIYRIGAKIGINATQPNVVESVTAVDIADGSKYKYLIGFQAAVSADLPIADRLTLHGDLMIIQKKFKVDLVVNRGTEVGTGKQLFHRFNGTEKQTWLSLPLSIEYRPLKSNASFIKNFNPYLTLGVSADYLLGGDLTAERIRDDGSSIPEASYDLEREKVNLSVLAGIGIKKRIAGGYFVAEIRYLYGITKVNSDATAYSNQEATWGQGYADPVFKLSSLSITGSYIQNIFSPKKLKRKK